MNKTSKSLMNKLSFGLLGKHPVAAQICAWTIASALVLDVAARVAFESPSAETNLPRYQEFLNSQNKSDVVVLGSSVALCSSFCADESLKRLNEKDKYRYTDAIYLEKKLQENCGENFSCKTLATSGSMASDAWILTKKLVEFDKKPKLLVFETVSRDFFDASMPQIGDTPVYKTIASLHPESKSTFLPKPVVEAVDYLWRSPFITALTITFADTRFLTDPERLQFCVDSIASSVSYAYKARAEHRNWLAQRFCALLNRGSSLPESSQNEFIERKKRNPFASLSTVSVDSRPQEKRYADELVYFEKFVKLCKDNSIELVVVFLPVGSEYKSKVPVALRKRFPGDCLDIAKRHDIKALDYIEKTAFNSADFSDFVHLNKSGAVKLTDMMASDLVKGPSLSTHPRNERSY